MIPVSEENIYCPDITFSDVLITPQFSEIRSRSTGVDLTTNLGKIKISLPVISANMKTVTGPKMAIALSKYGGLGILHRFFSVETSVNEFQTVLDNLKNPEKFGVSVGVGGDSKERFDALFQSGARVFCIDVAHGHHILMKEMLEWIKSNYNSDDVCIIAGNVATGFGADDLSIWGADIIKAGIGPGRGCATRKNTGVGVPQFSALKEIREQVGQRVPVISDGGIQYSGDVSKALIYSDAVMVGSMLAGTSESPGNVYRGEDDQYYKVYGGSASGESKTSNGQENKFIEGITTTIPFKGKVKYILKEIREGCQSAFSYTGAENMDAFHKRVKYRIISNGGQRESKI